MADGALDQWQNLAGVDCQGLKSGIKSARKWEEDGCSAKSLPLAGKSFYLDLSSGKLLKFLTETVEGLGGVVESFLSKEVSYVISSSREARQESWAPTQSSVVSRNTPIGALPSAGRGPSHKSMGTALISRGKELLHKAIRSQVKLLASGLQLRKVAQLKPPFLKIEDESRQLRPLLRQFKNFPEPCFLALRKHSPFESPQVSPCSKAPEDQPNSPSLCHVVPQKKRGYCECCQEAFTELPAHLRSPQHKEFALDPSHYFLVDALISQLTNDFAAFSWTSPLRVPPAATCDKVSSGLQREAAKETTVLPSGQAAPAEESMGCSLSPEGFAHLLVDQDFLQLTELPLGALDTPVPLALQSPRSPFDQAGGSIYSGPDKAGAAIVNAVACSEADHGAAPQWAWPLVQPSVLSCKRKLSCSPSGQAKKRQVLAEKPVNERLLSGDQQGATDLGDGQTTLGHLGLPAIPLDTSNPLCVSLQFSQGDLTCNSCKPVAIDASPVQQLDKKQVSAFRLHKERDTRVPCNFTSSIIESKSVPSSPVGSCISPKLPNAMAQHWYPCMGILELAQDVLPQQPGLGPISCQPLPTEASSSSSETEWDGPLLCVLAGASRLPFRCPVDAELLGTCVSMQDSSYASHLCSALWKTPELDWACKEDLD
ncbi:hypothetical protein lerEdw1_017548 [Lerista edwardsae]|nr:hypothetical protein lerEdw1_017548 [Lerista edwardsae]